MRSTRDSRLDLLLFGPGQGRSGCGVAALWCTTHAGFGHFSPTYRVPSGTSRAKSGRVYSAQTSMTVTRLIAGSAGLNAAGIMPKVHDILERILKALLRLIPTSAKLDCSLNTAPIPDFFPEAAMQRETFLRTRTKKRIQILPRVPTLQTYSFWPIGVFQLRLRATFR